MGTGWVLLVAGLAAVSALGLRSDAALASRQTRIENLTIRQGEVPRRLVGYGLVVGLDGTGDRSFGGHQSGNQTVRSVVNLLRRFGVDVPTERLRLRNAAAVLVTAEISPYLRSGGRFDAHVAALGDATSLRGGILWTTPLVGDPGGPAVATAQGRVYMAGENTAHAVLRRGNSGVIPQGGVLENSSSPAGPPGNRLLLIEPDLSTALRIAETINRAFGEGTARLEDPGALALTPGPDFADQPILLLAAIDTLVVEFNPRARIVIDARGGTVVAGGEIEVGPAVIEHHGITLRVGGAAGASEWAGAPGSVEVARPGSVQDVVAGLHAAGAASEETAALLEALKAAGALDAEIIVR